MKPNIICLKHGTLYGPEYVNRLYSMVCKHCTLPFTFICLTEDPTDLHENIVHKELPDLPLKGWWFKPYIFSKDLKLKGTTLYLDLDLIIVNNIDKLFTYLPGEFCIAQDFTRQQVPSIRRFNSSIMKYDPFKHSFIWSAFERDMNFYCHSYRGDQDYIYKVAKNSANLFPYEWLLSYKWEIRKQKRIDLTMPQGTRKLLQVEDPDIPEECCIAVFHGDPKPDNCDDPIVDKHWR